MRNISKTNFYIFEEIAVEFDAITSRLKEDDPRYNKQSCASAAALMFINLENDEARRDAVDRAVKYARVKGGITPGVEKAAGKPDPVAQAAEIVTKAALKEPQQRRRRRQSKG